MSGVQSLKGDGLSELGWDRLEGIIRACDRYEDVWQAGQWPRIEDYLGEVPDLERPMLLRELLMLELELRRGRGERPTAEEYRARFPGQSDLIDAALQQDPNSSRYTCPRPRARPTAPDPAGQAGHNLLFGVLALQNNFLGRDDLLGAFVAWVADKTRPLAQILVDRGVLDDVRRALLEALVAEHLKQHGGDPAASLAATSSLGPVREDIEGLGHPALQATLAHVAAARAAGAGGDAEATATYTSPSSRRAGERFRILRFHREGGLGRVYVARDEELGREVALKEIRPDKVAEAHLRGRFVLEAEINGGLEHPGIVPVYSLGTYDDGRPFYAMRFVEGDSLKEAIETYHNEHPRPDPSAVEFRKLLGRFIDVCEAIAFAHSKGVLHRDLKPHNVMLGRFGETLLIDWGLAKATGRRAPIGPEAADEATLVPPSGSGHAPTVGVLGSPPYMSPEQAAGEVESLGPATDVYGLGAILFALLTGEPPVEGRTVEEILDRARQGAIRSPRSLNPSIPRSLEAVCLKALASQPVDRYPTALALAEEVQHWLADEPVSALPESWSQRWARWSRRHRAWVQAGAVSVTLIALLTLGFAIQQFRAAKRLRQEQANTKAAQAKTLAALSAVEAERDNVRREKRTALRSLSDYYRERGQTLCERGDVSNGLLWITRALTVTPADEDNRQYAIRTSLSTLSRQFSPLKAILPSANLTKGSPKVRWGMAFSPDGKRIVIRDDEHTARIWNAIDGAPIGKPMMHQDRITGPWGDGILSIAFSPDGQTILTLGHRTARLWSAADGSPIGKPIEPLGETTAAAFRPDGKAAVIGGFDGPRLWNTVDASPISNPSGSRHAVRAVAFSPDGTTFLTGSDGGSAQLWSAADGSPVGKPMRHEGPVYSVAFRPDGKAILTRSGTGTVRLWSLANYAPIGKPMDYPDPVWEVGFSSDGKILLARNTNGITAQLGSDTAESPIGKPITHRSQDGALAFSPDGKIVLTWESDTKSGWSGSARLWSAADGSPIGKPMTHPMTVTSVAFSPDGKTVLTGSRDRTARLWNAADGSPIGGPIEHPAEVVFVTFNPDGTTFLTRSGDSVRLWGTPAEARIGRPLKHGAMSKFMQRYMSGNVVTRTVVNEKPANFGVLSAAFSPDGSVVLTGGSDGSARLWSAAAGSPIGSPMEHESYITAVAFSPDGKFAFTASQDGTARLWSAVDGSAVGRPLKHDSDVNSVAFSRDGKTVLLSSRWIAQLWSAIDGVPIGHPIRSHVDSSGRRTLIRAAALSPDDKTILTGSDDGSARLWSAADGSPIGKPMTHPMQVTSVAFSPDGKTVLTGSWDRTARLWSAAAGSPIGQPMRHRERITSIAFSPDSKTVLTASDDGTARLWSATDGSLIVKPLEHQSWVGAAVFSPDGKIVLTGADRTARLWNVADGSPIGRPIEHPAPVREVLFSPDDRTFLTASTDLTARLWRAPSAMAGDARQISLWAQVITGMELLEDSNATRPLDPKTWQDRRRQFGEGGHWPAP
jgi:WD40 repeat protein/serine/threonine protein kinase